MAGSPGLALSTLAEIDEEQQRFTPAAQLRLALKLLRPDDPAAHRRFLSLAARAVDRGDAEQAEDLLERYLELFPDSATANSLLERARARG